MGAAGPRKQNSDGGAGAGIDSDFGTGTGTGTDSDVVAMTVQVDHLLDQAALRRTFGAFPSGVTALAGLVDDQPMGMAASSFTSVSLDPPLVSVCVATQSSTWPLLRRPARLGVSVLGHDQEEVCRRLATRGVDRFADLAWTATDDGAVLLTDASAWLDCSIEREIRAGDHEIVVLAVHRLGADPDVPPLVFHGSRYRRLAL